MQFQFQITNTKRLLYGVVAWLIQVLAAAYLAIVTMQPTYRTWHIATAIIALVILIRGGFIIFKKLRQATYTHLFLILILIAIFTQQYITAALLFLFALAEIIVNRDWQCITNEQGIKITTIPSKKYNWPELQNVMISNGYFTIDKKNNQLTQIDISKEIIPFDANRYNTFVVQQLQKPE